MLSGVSFVLAVLLAITGWALFRRQRLYDNDVLALRARLATAERTATSLREADFQCRAAADALPIPVAVTDSQGVYLYVNESYRDWLGRPSEDLVGRNATEAGGPIAVETLAQHLRTAGVEGRPAAFESLQAVRSVAPQTTVTLLPHRLGDDRRGVLVVIEDISAHRRTEEELRRSEGTTAAILEAAVDGVVTIDVRGRVESFNRAAERIFGYAASEVIGRNVNILMPEPYHSAHDGYLHNYLATGQAKIIGIGREVEGRRKNGTTFPMELAVGESRVSGRRIFAGIIRDITERKLTEERLRHSEERFRLLVEGVRDYSIIMLDNDGRITSWNLGAERINGWTADEVIGRDFSCFFTPEQVVAKAPEKALQTVREEGRYEAEGWRIRKGGGQFWAHVVMTPLRNEAGQLRGYVRISRDMSEQKHVQADLMRAKEEAERAKEEAERANLAKSKFLAAASHDLRQPVQALFFFSSALSHKLRNSPGREVLGDLERSLEALNMLLDSLLDISKLDAGIVAPKETVFSVASLLERMETEFGPPARHKGLRLQVVGNTASIRSDPALLSRILQNLVANAVRYTPRGKILVGCRRRGSWLRIEVWDSGIGIPKDRLKEIFQEFYQIGNFERDRTQGLGLGLAIVDRLVKLLGLRIDLRSTLGRGSMFAIEVPLGAQEVDRRPSFADGTASAPSGNRLVVIIDDELSVLSGLRLILEEWGFEVLAASSEEEAMDALERHHRQPNAIVADYRLRDGRTGTEAIRHIRDLFDFPIPSIIITGDTAPERLREAEASGLRILHKPVHPPQLHSLLATTMGHG